MEHDDMTEQIADRLVVETSGAELSEDDERPAGLLQVVDELLWQTVVVDSRGIAADDALSGQGRAGELEERFRDGHVDMHAGVVVGSGLQQCFVGETVAMPGISLWQGDGAAHPGGEDTGLPDSLSVELANPLGRAVGRDDDERLVLVERLGNGGCHVEHGCAAGDADHYGLVCGLGYAQGEEARRAFVSDRVARDVGTLVEVVDDILNNLLLKRYGPN